MFLSGIPMARRHGNFFYLNTGEVIISCDVGFHEDQFPYNTSSTVVPAKDLDLPIVKIILGGRLTRL